VQREAQTALRALASCDGLTGLANRRMFDECLSQEWRRTERDGSPLSLLMIDIDHFKALNDVAGHQAGDDCLRLVAAAVSSEALRPGDLAARYGGEEFGAILPNTSLDGATVVASRILAAVAALAIPHPAAEIGGFVTVSIGAAGRSAAQASPALLVSAADAALYRAKRGGRNRVVTALTGGETPDVAAA
jgi:diguanylate cyclase (GGDEF)-like protein